MMFKFEKRSSECVCVFCLYLSIIYKAHTGQKFTLEYESSREMVVWGLFRTVTWHMAQHYFIVK